MSPQDSLFQSTRPARGATTGSALCAFSCNGFNPRAPRGARQSLLNMANRILDVSIHAPRAGRDRKWGVATRNQRPVSIHAPRAGRDGDLILTQKEGDGFNPRAPRGARPLTLCGWWLRLMFQSTRPARGATRRRACPAPKGTGFNPRAPRGARRDLICVPPILVAVSIHAPRAGRDRNDYALQIRETQFQSTRPARGATLARWIGGNWSYGFNPRAPRGARLHADVVCENDVFVSIHAPRAGRDCAIGFKCQRAYGFQSTRPARGATCGVLVNAVKATRFNPRAPRGARRTLSPFDSAQEQQFQSTRPARGATYVFDPDFVSDVVSIHAPRAGRDVHTGIVFQVSTCFNPRAPRGARPLEAL